MKNKAARQHSKIAQTFEPRQNFNTDESTLPRVLNKTGANSNQVRQSNQNNAFFGGASEAMRQKHMRL